MRKWLVAGTRRFAVDPRRRFGRHGGARRMLASDGEVVDGKHGAWGGLVSALRRHTVHGELAQLSDEDREIISLAYLGGHSNREIAAMLQVSVSTVGRRLSTALERLEDSLRRAGVGLLSLPLLVRTHRWPATVALLAAGTATTVAMTIAVVPPTVSGARPASTAVVMRPLGIALHARPVALVLAIAAVAPVARPEKVTVLASHSSTPDAVTSTSRICHGNPTSAAPPTPVGPRGGQTGPPVTHPGPGGCAHTNK